MLVASELFMERGFESVTIKDIAQAVGVNTALIYYYFKNKEDLLRATIESLVDQALQTYEQIHEKHDRPRDVIDDWIDTHVQLRDPIRKLVKISLDYRGLRRKSRHIDKAIDRFYEREHQILEDVIERGMRQGEFRSVDANSFARFISIHLDGIMVASVIRPEIDPTNGMEYLRGIIGQQLGNSTSSNGLRGINPGAGGRQKQA
ncbi:MAG: TetR/AcrR family transcriptional regulator [Gammaproteobacteria bacterium]